MENSKKVLLLYAPPCDPTQSYTSVPTLTAHLRGSGIDVEQRDVGIEILDSILKPEYLARLWATENLWNGEGDSAQTKAVERAKTFRSYIESNILEAKNVLRSEEFYDLDRYYWATEVIERACEIASLPHFPTQLTSCDYRQFTDCTLKGLLRATENDQTDNMMAALFRRFILPGIESSPPELVGISITYHFQIVPGLTLARLLKESLPDTRIVIGGAVVSRMESHLLSDSRFSTFADYFVVGEGEVALERIVRKIRGGIFDCSDIENVVSFKTDGGPITIGTDAVVDLSATGTPDYSDVDWGRYLSPEPVVLLPASRGCYWGKCSFCDVSRQTRTSYRPIGRHRVVAEMKKWRFLVGARNFFFCDDAVPLGTIKEVSESVRTELPDVHWQAEVRFEKGMSAEFIANAAKGGCKQLMFGFESSSQRVLDMMEKSNSVDRDNAIIEACYNNGIALNLQTFVGLPGEQLDEAVSTIDFLDNNERMICSIGFGLFSLWKDTPIYNEPEKHNVMNIYTPIEDNLLTDMEFETMSGMSRDEAKSVAEFGKKKLGKTYRTRSKFLGGAAGSHSLLHLGRRSFKELYNCWSEREQRKRINIDARLQVCERLCITRSPEGCYVFVPDTAECYELGPIERTVLDTICATGEIDGDLANLSDQEYVSEIASRTIALKKLVRDRIVEEASNA